MENFAEIAANLWLIFSFGVVCAFVWACTRKG